MAEIRRAAACDVWRQPARLGRLVGGESNIRGSVLSCGQFVRTGRVLEHQQQRLAAGCFAAAISRPTRASQPALGCYGVDLDDLTSLVDRANVQAHDADAHDAIRIFFETWNQRRDARPSFVAFYDEVKEEADGEDWMHALRDRLGLGHLGQTDGSPLPVALMRYPLGAAMRDALGTAGQTACALPTVLDGGMHEHFFSVPRESAYGATLHLNPDQASVLTAEVVHRRFDYLPEHLWRIGHIQEPQSLRDNALRASRDLHLLELRQGTKRQDFGEPFEGRS